MNYLEHARYIASNNAERIASMATETAAYMSAPAHRIQGVINRIEADIEEMENVDWSYVTCSYDRKADVIGLYVQIELTSDAYDEYVERIEEITPKAGRFSCYAEMDEIAIEYRYTIEMPEDVIETLKACDKIIEENNTYMTTVC
jgi:hypothetical protein